MRETTTPHFKWTPKTVAMAIFWMGVVPGSLYKIIKDDVVGYVFAFVLVRTSLPPFSWKKWVRRREWKGRVRSKFCTFLVKFLRIIDFVSLTKVFCPWHQYALIRWHSGHPIEEWKFLKRFSWVRERRYFRKLSKLTGGV